MIALLVATLDEAGPLLTRLGAEKFLDRPFPAYRFPARDRRPGGVVVISGMGPSAAAAAAEHAIAARGATRIVNLGICGALTDAMEVGRLCRVAETVDGDALDRGERPAHLPLASDGTWPSLSTARLATVTESVFCSKRRAALAAEADVVDMEGFAIARVCRERGIPCVLLKAVSDGASDGGREELLRNLPALSEALAREAADGLARLAPPRGSLPARLANFVKVEHTIFSLPLLFAGAWLGAGGRWPGLRVLLLVAIAGLGARALGMAMNRILDRRLDLMNPRTAGRELPSGRMSPAQAWAVAGAGLAVYLIACAMLGPACWRLSPIPAAVLVSYSLLKRFTSLCHFGIGLCLALGPLGAYVAASGGTDFTPPILLLAVFTFCWMSGFDIIYALQDMEADRATGVHSLPAALGSRGAQAMAALAHLVAAAAAVRLWWLLGAGTTAGIALAAAIVAFGAAYCPALPLPARFFPVSAIAGAAGAMIPLLGGPR